MKIFLKNPFSSAAVFLLIGIFIVVILQFIPGQKSVSSSAALKNASEKLVSLRDEMKVTLDNIVGLTNEKEYGEYISKNTRGNSGFSYYVLRSGKIMYWSDNEPAVSDSLLLEIKNGEVLKLPNGDFLASSKKINDKIAVGLILLRHSYQYENKYLINNFNPALGIGNGYLPAEKGDTLFLPDNTPLYILKAAESYKAASPVSIVIAYAIAFVFFLISFYLFLRLFSCSFLSAALFVFFITGLRACMLFLKIPEGIYELGIFSPANYASSFFFNSLGDMLINASLLLIFSIGLFENCQRVKKLKAISTIALVAAAVSIHYLIRGLIINSKISFELNSPVDINLYSILAFVAVSLLLFCFLFFTAFFLKNNFGFRLSGRHAWIGITLCAVYTSMAFTILNIKKEKENRKLIAEKAVMNRDHVAEFIFNDQEQKISTDTVVRNILNSSSNISDDLSIYLLQKYFSGYLSKYELAVLNFNDTSLNRNSGKDYYTDLSGDGEKTISKNLFFLKNESGGSSYIGLLPVKESLDTLVLLFTPRFFQSTKGFPELFISGNYTDNSIAGGYSLARYSSQSLVYEFGNYIYPLSGKGYITAGKNDFISQNGYSHYIHRADNTSFLVVSKPESTILSALTLFSWMFIFLSITGFSLFILSGIVGKETAWQWNLTRRVQTSVIFLVILAFVMAGTGTVYFIKNKYTNDLRKSISDQVNALWYMVNESLISSMQNQNLFTEEQFVVLDQLVKNTNIDFNLFSSDGTIVYSSQPKIFEKGIVSKRMNPEAYFTIREEGPTQFIHPENAGLLKYISAYAPFTDPAGNIVAILNLPYLEKQNELNKDVSVFLSALVNIYVLLFALAVIVTLFISSQIARPLLLIRENMSGIKFGSVNEKIDYSDNDEIGQLVHEYNRMIDELIVSADKLAQSERESAWREMARQVAHEIKNPLTPMKLSVQHLHRAFKDKGFGEDPIVDRISSTLIQQIDTLSNIATAFSNFARMPNPVLSRTNVNETLNQVIQLYSDGIEIELKSDEENAFILADKDQLIGIFSNLLKNAIQSIDAGVKGKVNVLLSRQDGCIVVEIRDNGVGIPEDQRDKIFIPSFTTKSSGMGLGLAITKKLVESASGKIWFTSIYGNGTSFFVSFPEAR